MINNVNVILVLIITGGASQGITYKTTLVIRDACGHYYWGHNPTQT